MLDMYGDCAGASFPFLSTASPQVEIYDNSFFYTGLNLTLAGPPVEVTPVCPSQINNTTCNGGTIPGVKKFTYTATVTLSGLSANWLFRFTGDMGNNSLAGRSNSMTNIMIPAGPGGGSIMVLEATLNNLTAPNSTVVYTTIPTPFFCINMPTQYNPGAVDPNGDNLSFGLVSGIEPGGPATYLTPYTPAQPLAVLPGSFSFNGNTGQLGFNPNQLQTSLVVYRVEEWRNGILVGTSMREMTFIVLNNCNNAAPVPGPITGLMNSTQTGPFQIQACKGAPGNVSFHFTASDPNGDAIGITYAGLPSGATAVVVNNNTTSPQFSFSWNVSGMVYGTYTFYVTLKDNGCPLASTQTYAYSVTIVPFGNAPATGAMAGCIYGNFGKAWVMPIGSNPFSFTWRDANNQIVHQTTGSTIGDTAFNLAPGTYSVYLVNNLGCDSTIQVTVPAASYDAKFSSDSVVCLGKPASFQNISSSNMNTWDWDFGDGATSLAKSPSHTYTQPGIHNIRLIGSTSLGCQDTFFAQINVKQVILSVSPDQTICEGQRTGIYVSGASTYQWTPATGLSCPTCSQTFASPITTTNYVVTGVDAFGCSGSAQTQITVLPTGLEVNPNDTSVCPMDSIQLHVSGADSFKWHPTTGLSDTGVHPWVHPKGNLTYMVTATYANGCHDTEFVKIRYVSNAVISLPDSATIFPGESYQMDPQGNCLYFQWFPPLGLNNTRIANPIARPPVNTRYYVEAITEGGCKTRDSIDIYVRLESLIDIPNAFTPGGGVNNVLQIIRRGDATLKNFSIFNRWGNKVFETTNIDEGWDGTFKGSMQPMGVYVFMIEAYTNKGTKFYKQGNVTLIR